MKTSFITALVSIIYCTSACASTYQSIPFNDLKDRYNRLPLAVTLHPQESGFYYNQATSNDTNDFYFTHKGIEKEEFENVVEHFKTTMINNFNNTPWTSKEKLDLTTSPAVGRQHPYYIEKLVIPDDAKIFFIGDLHGDVHTFIKQMEKLQKEGYLDNYDAFKITDAQKVRIVILGDCNDKGHYSAELWNILMRYKIQNPKKFFIIRGNHEDQVFSHNFEKELEDKFGKSEPKKENVFCSRDTRYTYIRNMNSLLPVALFIGKHNLSKNHIDYTLFSHAGLELGWQDHKVLLHNTVPHQYQVISHLDRLNQAKQLPHNIIDALQAKIEDKAGTFSAEFKPIDLCSTMNLSPLGFMWNYYKDDADTIFHYREGSCWEYGKPLFNAVIGLWSNCKNALSLSQYFGKYMYRYIGYYLGITKYGLTYRTVTNIRSHQHAAAAEIGMFPEMLKLIDNKGLYKQWSMQKSQAEDIYQKNTSRDNTTITYPCAFTLLCAPANVYGYPYKMNEIANHHTNESPYKGHVHAVYFQPFNFATIGMLSLANSWKKWKISTYNVKVFEKSSVALPKGATLFKRAIDNEILD